MTASRSDDARLPEAAERLLKGWPAPDADWEQMATNVEGRLRHAKIGATPDDLLAAPLPASAEELARVSAAARPERGLNGAVSLAELARQSLAEGAKDASTRDIARQSISLSNQGRQQASALAEGLRAKQAEGAAQAGATSPAAPGEAPNRTAPEPGAPRRAPAPRRDARQRLIIVGTGVVAAALAAMAVFWMRGGERPPLSEPPPVAVSKPPAAPKAQQPAVETPAPAPAPEPPSAAPSAREPEEAASGSKTAERPAAPAQRVAPRQRPAPPPVVAKRPPAEPKPAPESPADELKQDPELRPADSDRGVTSKPALGAVNAAIGAVMGGARACVAAHDAPSRATVVFGSNGRVQNVQVSGPAAGTPAEGCIQSALRSARVQPFADPSFSVAVTVRP